MLRFSIDHVVREIRRNRPRSFRGKCQIPAQLGHRGTLWGVRLQDRSNFREFPHPFLLPFNKQGILDFSRSRQATFFGVERLQINLNGFIQFPVTTSPDLRHSTVPLISQILDTVVRPGRKPFCLLPILHIRQMMKRITIFITRNYPDLIFHLKGTKIK